VWDLILRPLLPAPPDPAAWEPAADAPDQEAE
jgi:hypothetical protein